MSSISSEETESARGLREKLGAALDNETLEAI